MTSARARSTAPTPVVEIIIGSDLWNTRPEIEALARRAAIEAAAMTLPAQKANCEISVLLTDAAAVHALNRKWRGQDKPTNVLSFPASRPAPQAGTPGALGDIVLAYETVAHEADEQHISLADHVAHLVVHGLLHLLGYDHQTDEEARTMEDLERRILTRLGIADPYAAHELQH